METDSLKTAHEIIRVSFDYHKPSILIESSWLILLVLFCIIVAFYLIRRKLLKNYRVFEMNVEISGTPKTIFKVKRNTENLYIANRIYIELTTRKAAIEFDENHDIILEIYNSWYDLFKIIRSEIKNLPGEYLQNHNPSKALLGLTTKILNCGLRPHLTEYQAKYRQWYEKNKSNYEGESPQEIQKHYPDYANLVTSMKNVNSLLKDYSIELERLINGK